MVQYETYRSNAVEAPVMRRWLLAGLVLSLLLHACLFVFFYQHRLEGFGVAPERLAPPRMANLKQVTISNTPEPTDQKLKLPESNPHSAPITLPSEAPEVQELHIAPQIPDLPKQTFADKPKADMAGMDKIAKTDAAARAEMDREINSISQTLIKEGQRLPHQPIMPVGSGKGAGAGEGSSNISIPGLATIDDIVAKSGSLRAGDKAGIPGGALFEYDSYDLRDEALEQLRKLGTLIQRNPRATFSIEGHTDSFGGPEYNQRLSLARAESVKAWLVKTFGIAPERIQTRGFGNSKPLVSADKSKEEQAPNRRVELVVKTNRS
jgi:outer membrane protein OmpA-like peptidoglycan-associated protein